LVDAPDTVVTLSLTGIGGTFKVPVAPGDSFIIAGLNPGAYALAARATWQGKVYVDTFSGPLALGYAKTRSGITVGMIRSRWSVRHSILFGTTSVRDGDALAGASVSGKSYVYALKGSASNEFYRYDPAVDVWSTMAIVPLGVSGYPASTGAALTSVGGKLYATKGTQSPEFYRYDPVVDNWSPLQNVPQAYQAGAGGSLAGMERGDSSYVWFVQGGSDWFAEYSVSGDSWVGFPMVPGPMSNGFEYGTGMTSNGALTPYVLLGWYSDAFWSYDFADWYWRSLATLPVASRSGMEISAYKGASLAYAQGAIYALKGGGTSEFWRYNPVTDSWKQLDDIPVGSFGISEGGAMAYCPGDSALYVLQGGRTLNFYRYDLSGLYYPAGPSVRAPSPGTRQASPIEQNTPRLSRDLATISYATTATCRVSLSLYDVAGKLRRRMPEIEVSAGKHEASVSTQGLRPGVYVIRLVAGTLTGAAKVVLE
jgi:N-acetylneuraminic acid mutarotase